MLRERGVGTLSAADLQHVNRRRLARVAAFFCVRRPATLGTDMGKAGHPCCGPGVRASLLRSRITTPHLDRARCGSCGHKTAAMILATPPREWTSILASRR